MRKIAILAALVLSAAVSHAQNKIAIKINCTNGDDDSVGIRYCSALRDTIALSPRYRLQTPKDTAYLQLDLNTLSISEGSDAAVALLVYSKGKFLEYRTIWNCQIGSDRVTEVASSLLAKVDAEINN